MSIHSVYHDRINTQMHLFIGSLSRCHMRADDFPRLTLTMVGREFLMRLWRCGRISPSSTACVCWSVPVTMLPRVRSAGNCKQTAQSMTSTNTPYQHDQYQHVWEDGPAHHHSVLRVCQERHQHWNDSTVHHHLHKEGKAIWYHSAIEGVWLGLHLNLLLLSICEEGEGPAGVHLHCQVIILYQVDQGRQGLEGDQMS